MMCTIKDKNEQKLKVKASILLIIHILKYFKLKVKPNINHENERE